jgi:hypothetical protein
VTTELITEELVELLAKRLYEARIAAERYPANWPEWAELHRTIARPLREAAHGHLEVLAPLIVARDQEVSAAAADPCDSEVWSTDYFGQHFDRYWIRCNRLGPHTEHEDANTGLTWKETADV